MKQIGANIWIINSMDSSWVISGESSAFLGSEFCAKWSPWNDDICDPLWLLFILILLFDVRLSPLCDKPSIEREFKIDCGICWRHSHADTYWIFSSRFNPKSPSTYSNIHRRCELIKWLQATMHRPGEINDRFVRTFKDINSFLALIDDD